MLFHLQEEAERQADLYAVCMEVKNRMGQELEVLYERKRRENEKLKDLQTAQTSIYEQYVFKVKSRADYIEEKREFEKQEEYCRGMLDVLEKRIGELREMLSESETDVYEYLQNHSFTELTQEVADRFVKRIVVYDERNLEVEWKFSEELPEEVREYQLAHLQHQIRGKLDNTVTHTV